MKKDEKQKQVDALHAELAKARSIILSGFEGIKVADDTDLRRKVAQTGAQYRVVKNSLVERAAAGTPVGAVAAKLKGTTSLAYTEADPVALVKVLTAFAKEFPVLVFKAGVVEGRVVSLAEFVRIATMPSLHELRAKILFLIQAPGQRLAMSAAGVARNLAVVLGQAVKEKKFSEAQG
ncbi:MAG: 50S ribosomal protein L10 [Acidobacteria bacterium]|nr:MAG: 50S ribosomal protein L10 [Acidobacteriota bacterium]